MSFAPSPVSPALGMALAAEILPDERVLWQGQPLARRQGGLFAIYLFAVPWTLFALFWEAMALSPWFSGKPVPDLLRFGIGIVFPVFGLPFVGIGLWMLAKPWKAMRAAGQSVVALTNRRLLRLSLAGTRSCESVLLSQIGPMKRRSRADGVGDLSIETHSRIDSEGDRVTERLLLLGLPDVAGLERQILALAN